MVPVVDSVARLIGAQHAQWGTSAVASEVFGTGDAAESAAIIDRYCRHELGSESGAALFYGASAGCVLGLRLADGAEVVIKAYQEGWRAPFLRAVQAVQAHMATSGFPCATPLVGPATLVPGRPNLAMVESLLPDPGMRPYSSATERRASADGLARQIAACRELVPLPTLAPLADHPLRRLPGGLYGEPHSPLFDFAGTAASAEWIDALATRALELRDADRRPPVIAHTDWAARNVRLNDDGLVAVYDWDSVALVTESTAVGQAAATWSVTADPGGTEFPTAPDIAGFVADYEEAPGARLDDEQWRAAGAAAAYTLAYTARCEHSLDAKGMARPDQHAARDRLAEAGERLLALERVVSRS
ncbi:MAG: phosphotransferase [Acidimicrobiales bacterium]